MCCILRFLYILYNGEGDLYVVVDMCNGFKIKCVYGTYTNISLHYMAICIKYRLSKD